MLNGVRLRFDFVVSGRLQLQQYGTICLLIIKSNLDVGSLLIQSQVVTKFDLNFVIAITTVVEVVVYLTKFNLR